MKRQMVLLLFISNQTEGIQSIY
jgi:hypothetical protein